MSRIESALNRTRAANEEAVPDVGVVPDGTPEAELFVGPWEVSTDPEPPVRVATPSPVPAASALPAAEPREVALALSPTPAPATHFRDDVVEKVVGSNGPAPAAIEQYRRLAAKLHQTQIDRDLKIVMVCSAVPAEGKTLTSINLALTLSRSYKKRVLLIDADLRRPSVHEVLGLQVDRGLQDAVLDPAGSGALAPVYEVASGLSVLPAGKPTSDPMGVLTSPQMRAILHEARRTFDWVIVDTAPIAALPDAQVLKDIVDGALLVVSAASTPFDLVERAVATLGRDHVLGVVLNGVADHDINTAYGYTDYYGKTGAYYGGTSAKPKK